MTGLVSMTFDDGSRVQYERLYPVLREYGLPASFYVTTSQIGRPGKMTWPELEELHENGHEIGSHSHTHPHLPRLSEAKLDFELRMSKELLHNLGCETFAYPFGEFDARVISSVQRYYSAARAYYDPSTGGRSHGYNYGLPDEMYRLRVFPTEHASFPDIPLLELSAFKFQETLHETIQNGIAKAASMIFVFHQAEDFSFPTIIDFLVNQPDALVKTFIHRRGLLRSSLQKQHLRKFSQMCKYLSQQEKVRVLTVNELVKTYISAN